MTIGAVAPSQRRGGRESFGGRLAGQVERIFVRHRRKLVFVHLGMFALFALLLIGPLLVPRSGSTLGLAQGSRALALYFVWTLWFPLVYLSVIFSGRS